MADARVALLGVVDGGNLVVRAAAGEPRVDAVVCDPGVVRPLDGALAQLPDALVAQWRKGEVSPDFTEFTDALDSRDRPPTARSRSPSRS